MNNLVAFIPAREGSVGVKGKNWRNLAGTPLIKWTLDFALKAPTFKKIVVSTDSAAVCEISTDSIITRTKFNDLPEASLTQISEKLFLHKRPSKQAQTLSLINEVLFEFVATNRIFEGVDYLMLLQPTSPFRNQEELGKILVHLGDSNWSSVVSVSDVGGMHPDRMYSISHNRAIRLVSQIGSDNMPRQLLDKIYIKDGAYYLLRMDNLRNNIMLGNEILPFIRSGYSTINIDSEKDFILAEYVCRLNLLND